MNRIDTRLKYLLKVPDKSAVSRQEKKLLKKEGELGLVYQRITSTKFRKSSVEKETEKFIKNYLERAIKNKEPIKMYFLFGGYKQARLSSAPYPDWAEIFTVSFALEAVSYVESIYEPGVDVVYRGDEVIMSYLSNYKVEDRDSYTKRFNQIINLFSDNIPKNRKITLKYELTRETSPEDKLIPLMEELYPKYLKKFEELDPKEQERRIWKSYRNHQWDGHKDLTGLSEKEKKERAKWAYIMHDAFIEADVKLAGEHFDNVVSITYRSGVPYCLHYGATSSSSVQFWAGEGFLVKREDRIIPWIYSYEQMEDLKSTETKVKVQEFVDLGLDMIRVVDRT